MVNQNSPNEIWLLFLFSSKSLSCNVNKNLLTARAKTLFSILTSIDHTQWHPSLKVSIPLITDVALSFSSSLSDVSLPPSSSSASFASQLTHYTLPLHLYFYGYYLTFSYCMSHISIPCDSMFKLPQFNHRGGMGLRAGTPGFATC